MEKKKSYEIEIMYDGEHYAWYFEKESPRTNLYEKVVTHFSGKELDKDDAIRDKANIVQISTYNQFDSPGIAQVIPHVWYDESLFEELFAFVKGEYEKMNNDKVIYQILKAKQEGKEEPHWEDFNLDKETFGSIAEEIRDENLMDTVVVDRPGLNKKIAFVQFKHSTITDKGYNFLKDYEK